MSTMSFSPLHPKGDTSDQVSWDSHFNYFVDVQTL